MTFNAPILFLVFNRPDITKLVFGKIRQVQPKKLYIAADGPRDGKAGELEKTDLVRRICTNVDWDCKVHTLFRHSNLGCGKAVSEGINWFFELEEEGIILEDDCLPDNSFFHYCSQLLERYRTDQRVFAVSGSNLLGRPWKSEMHSYFWALPGIWGWATWRRAWKLYDFEMKGWENSEIRERIKDALKTKGWFEFYYHMFKSTYDRALDTWDVQWLFTILLNGGLAANPSVNLVKNIGFGEQATHTGGPGNILAGLTTNSLPLPLQHPPHFITDVDYLNQLLINISPKSKSNTRLSKAIVKIKNLINW